MNSVLLQPFPVTLDTISGGLKTYFNEDVKKETWLSTGNYYVLYIGKEKDTLYVDHFLYSPPAPPDSNDSVITVFEKRNNINTLKPFLKELSYNDEYTYPYAQDTNIVKIHVDTTQKIGAGYPVLIRNSENDTIILGTENRIMAQLEACDSTGNWSKIEEEYLYICGFGLRSLMLGPNQVVLTKVPIFTGDYLTDLRLKLGDNYSNVFSGYIYYRQFEDRFNQYGEYKQAYLKEERTKIDE
ncbi:hypothetical protein IFO69_07815 [Echinicola sp. CAU 1574]|uniref:Uncharacterized protein n=1 Tax=Echinicola arenosa TaxID=2774144 RepID=A0ABR9AK05_9BACT|nr:hypothetical protein [Echinicola arenosa]MBD8488646.1 hypothetical protein [Echinicola arenosa]